MSYWTSYMSSAHNDRTLIGRRRRSDEYGQGASCVVQRRPRLALFGQRQRVVPTPDAARRQYGHRTRGWSGHLQHIVECGGWYARSVQVQGSFVQASRTDDIPPSNAIG
ncbi:hypothetical protein BD413DRAFT_567814 [Trametes elegans]|nr:hypothetical protein BD413DRAFT_567814 [Trametes elegans]